MIWFGMYLLLCFGLLRWIILLLQYIFRRFLEIYLCFPIIWFIYMNLKRRTDFIMVLLKLLWFLNFFERFYSHCTFYEHFPIEIKNTSIILPYQRHIYRLSNKYKHFYPFSYRTNRVRPYIFFRFSFLLVLTFLLTVAFRCYSFCFLF